MEAGKTDEKLKVESEEEFDELFSIKTEYSELRVSPRFVRKVSKRQ